jgi:hypothetical protein
MSLEIQMQWGNVMGDVVTFWRYSWTALHVFWTAKVRRTRRFMGFLWYLPKAMALSPFRPEKEKTSGQSCWSCLRGFCFWQDLRDLKDFLFHFESPEEIQNTKSLREENFIQLILLILSERLLFLTGLTGFEGFFVSFWISGRNSKYEIASRRKLYPVNPVDPV